ncbi:MAG TPA: hypothetical protein VK251_03465 [Steroidobacteraceae bacterium]|nr:hypothetical protein [Steroidobacteraceae bacterium]
MPEPEPLSRTSSSRVPQFLIGKDSRGRWVVRDKRGLSGGLFVNRADAIKFAMFESGRCARAVIMVPGGLEFDMARPSGLTVLYRPAA